MSVAYNLIQAKPLKRIMLFSMVMSPLCLKDFLGMQCVPAFKPYPQANDLCQHSPCRCMPKPVVFLWCDTTYFSIKITGMSLTIFFKSADCLNKVRSTCVHKTEATRVWPILVQKEFCAWSMRLLMATLIPSIHRRYMHANRAVWR